MLVATWVLAIATSVLALSGPVALFAWLGARRRDREQAQRDRDTQAAGEILRTARGEFLSKSSAGAYTFVLSAAAFIGWLIWSDQRGQDKPGKK